MKFINKISFSLKIIIGIIFFFSVFILCLIFGSTNIFYDLSNFSINDSILINIRLPRVLCAAMIGIALSVCGASMQSLLKNPLADGTTLGVSSGASLGAITAMIVSGFIGIKIFSFNISLMLLLSVTFAFVSFFILLSLTYLLDKSLSSNTIIMVGIVFTMLTSSIVSFLVSVFPEHAKNIMFWTMGSLNGISYIDCIVLFLALIPCIIIIKFKCDDLNIMSLGENKAVCLGINVKQVKIIIMLCVAVLIGVCVSISGVIGFVGLIIPHICRKICGANNNKIIPACVIFGSCFLMFCDLLSRLVVIPKELPIGIITSFIGAITFVIIFYKQRNGRV